MELVDDKTDFFSKLKYLDGDGFKINEISSTWTYKANDCKIKSN